MKMGFTKILFTALLCALLCACGGRPVKALSAAEKALMDASLAKKCAPDEYAAAQRLFEKAKALADKGDHGPAEATAKAAEELAKKAVAKAEARKEECLNPKEEVAAGEDEPGGETDDAGEGIEGQQAQEMKTIYFGYNVSKLSDEAREVLIRNADWINKNAESKVVIEGHCDERGSTEYNLALGEKRAKTALEFLLTRGVDSDRVSLVSYGKERLASFGDTDADHTLNRRAEFRVSE